MFAVFEKYIRTQAPELTDFDIKLIRAAAAEKTVGRRLLLLHAGEVCRFKLFIVQGFLRTYRIDDDGIEHVMQFSPEFTWCTDGESYNIGTPSVYYIEALEDTEIVYWNKTSFDRLMKEVPVLKAFSDQLIFSNLHSSRNRIYRSLSATPEQKYEDFVQAYPGILRRVPLRMVASYLGVSLKTLGRIRQAQLQR